MRHLLLDTAPTGFPIPFDQLLGPYGVTVLALLLWWFERRERLSVQERNDELEKEARAAGQKALDAMMTRDSQR